MLHVINYYVKICQESTRNDTKIDVVNVVHRLARDVDIAKRRC